MTYLALSILMLAITPILYGLSSKNKRVWNYLMIANRAAVFILVAGHLVPEVLEVAGYATLVTIAGGFLVPSLLERMWKSAHHQIHFTSLIASVLGFAVHGMLDGAALALPDGCCTAHTHAHDHSLSMAVFLHRIPVGILVWDVFYSPRTGARTPIILLTLLGAATCIGYGLSHWALPLGDSLWLAHFQALVSGSLFHVILDRHKH